MFQLVNVDYFSTSLDISAIALQQKITKSPSILLYFFCYKVNHCLTEIYFEYS